MTWNLSYSYPHRRHRDGFRNRQCSELYLNYRKRKDMFALYHQERMAAIEKGIELPPLPEDFFHEEPSADASRRSSHGTLLAGLILVFLGLTLYLALHFTVSRTERRRRGAVCADSVLALARLA